MGKRGQHGNHSSPPPGSPAPWPGGGLLPHREVVVAQPVPVVVTCHLCPDPDAGQIVTTADRAWQVAMDHALDQHRAVMIADPENGQAAFTVNSTGRPQPLRAPTQHQEATR